MGSSAANCPPAVPKAAVAHHTDLRLRGADTGSLTAPEARGPSPGRPGPAPLEMRGAEPPPFPSSARPQATVCSPIPPAAASVATWPPPVCLGPWESLVRALSRNPGQTPHLKTLYLIHWPRPPFPDKLTSVGMRMWADLLGLLLNPPHTPSHGRGRAEFPLPDPQDSLIF